MRLRDLLAAVPHLAITGEADPLIAQIVADSRQVLPGALFVAYHGLGVDGHRYIPHAVAQGAHAVVGEQPAPPGLTVPYIQVADGRSALAWLAAAWHGHPSRDLTLVGVTGTDGKTTTANLLYHMVQAAGRRVGLISTVNAVIGDATHDTGLHTTTPDALDVQRYLAQMRDAGAEIAILETTSHGLAQHRVTACAFDVAIVTNITHEHLDFHGSYAAYRDAKAQLFRALTDPALLTPPKTDPRRPRKTAVINRDDASYAYLRAIPADQTLTYGIATPALEAQPDTAAHSLTASHIQQGPDGMRFAVAFSPGETISITTNLVGEFNISNILAAMGGALALGLTPDAMRTGIAALHGVVGRMERIDRGQDFTAIVDFAHTPNALARALETVRALTAAQGRVIAVFGSAGLRDREKRRLMGQVAARSADYTIITAEDPRTEDLASILAETAEAMQAAGCTEGRDFVRIADRQAAILDAVKRARAGDVVICCGKGHEQSMCFGAVEHPWRDQDALRWALDQRLGHAGAQPPNVLPTWGEAG